MDFKQRFSILGLTLLAQAAFAQATDFQPLLAGVDSSGGGNAIVCRDANKQILTAEVLDLFEARVLYGYNIAHSSGDPVAEAQRRVTTLGDGNPYGLMSLSSNFGRVVKIAHILPDGVMLKPIDDSFSPIIPRDCQIEQLAAYQINNELYIDGQIWAKLDDTNRAVLYAHEAIYKTLRQFGATNSIRTRKIVGALFADQLIPVLDKSYWKAGIHLCTAKDSQASFYSRAVLYLEHTPGFITLHFMQLGGQPVVSKKTLKFDDSILLHPNPNRSEVFMDDPSKPINFENLEQFAMSATPGGFNLRVQSLFGDDSLNEDYDFACEVPAEKN